jgi:hypothetical protein
MCNLYSQTRNVEAVRRLFRVSSNRAASVEPRDAIFPEHTAPVVRKAEDGERELVELSWGFVLPQPGKAPRRVTNTRDDKVQSPFWRDSMHLRRCFVPSSKAKPYSHISRREQLLLISLRDNPVRLKHSSCGSSLHFFFRSTLVVNDGGAATRFDAADRGVLTGAAPGAVRGRGAGRISGTGCTTAAGGVSGCKMLGAAAVAASFCSAAPSGCIGSAFVASSTFGVGFATTGNVTG